MEREEKEALRKCRAPLCEDLELVDLLEQLEFYNVITPIDRQLINAVKTRYEKNGKFLDILRTARPGAFQLFVAALRNTNQSQVVGYLLEEIKDDRQSFSLPGNILLRSSATAVRGKMHPDDVAILNENHSKLVQEMNTSPVVNYLVSSSVFLDHHAHLIESITDRDEKNSKLLKMLKTGNEIAFDKFVEALHLTQQHELANHMRKRDLPKSTRAPCASQLNPHLGMPVANPKIPTSSQQIKPLLVEPAKTELKDSSQKLTLQSILYETQPNTCSIETWEKGVFMGGGSFGDVYKCTNHSNSQEIAGKYMRISPPTANGMLPKEKRRIAKEIQPVLNEVNIMMKLDHERVLKCFGFRTISFDLVIFTEFMQSGSVLDEIRRKGDGLDDLTTIKYLRQATEGLLYIHGKGICHRDLKCANLLLDDKKNVKLSDFGISAEIRLKNGMTSATFTENGNGGIKGTLLHMAPEALQSKTFSRKSDVWSIGCTVVEMLTTMSPHEEATEDWDTAKFILQAGQGNLKYLGSELCPDASVDIQALLDKIFQPVVQRITSEQLLVGLIKIEMSNRTLLTSLIPEEFENHELRIRSLEGWSQFEDPLDQGGFGLAFKYATPLMNITFAAGKHMKIDNPFNLSDENKGEIAKNVQSFLREIDVLHQLKSSERILKIIGYYYDEEKLILFTELMTHGSIKDQIQQEPLSEQRALKYFLQTAEGLRVLHHYQGERTIHRDIKCANLLLTDADNVKVADFGFAFSLSVDSYAMTKSAFAPKTAEGTPLYAAPEVLIGETYGKSADIWHLACTLVEMLTCNPPHQETWCALEKDGNSEGAFESFSKLNAELGYSRNLVPTASEGIRVLLDCLFTKDKNRRPKIDEICDVFSPPTDTGAPIVIDRERLFQLKVRLSSDQ